LSDIFAIQSDVARNIAAALRSTMSSTSPPGDDRVRNVEAYQLYLKGRFFLGKQTPDGLLKARQYFQQSRDLEPADARVYASLSTCYALAGHYDYQPRQEVFPKARASAQRALELDDRLTEAQISLGLVKYFYDWDWQGADQAFRRAIELAPNNVDAHTYYSSYLCVMRRFEEARGEAEMALNLDPLSPQASLTLAMTLAMAGRFDDALEQCQRTLEVDPNYLPARTVMAMAYWGKGMFDEAVRNAEAWIYRRGELAMLYALAGREQDAREEFERMAQGYERAASGVRERPSEIALLALLLGKKEEAADWLERAYQERDYMLLYHVRPRWSPWRADPLIHSHLIRMGLDP
jgi:tetratricopeptide (TPR) repeat protein